MDASLTGCRGIGQCSHEPENASELKTIGKVEVDCGPGIDPTSADGEMSV